MESRPRKVWVPPCPGKACSTFFKTVSLKTAGAAPRPSAAFPGLAHAGAGRVRACASSERSGWYRGSRCPRPVWGTAFSKLGAGGGRERL